MNADRDLERRIADFYSIEAPARAPDWVLHTTLETIDTTPQRRVIFRVPWRFPHMNTLTKVAIAAVVVIAVGALGLSVLRPSTSSNVGGQPTASPSPSPSPTFGATIIPEPPPALTETFTSKRHGFSISYPAGWDTTDATEPWTAPGLPNFSEPSGDFMYDPTLTDHLFLVVASKPLAGQDGAAWADQLLNAMAANDDCALPLASVTTGAGPARQCAGGGMVATWAGDRGYVIWLHTSDDDPTAVAPYDEAYFNDILATLKLQPEDAVDTPASPSASP
jgi:hypothetical protein